MRRVFLVHFFIYRLSQKVAQLVSLTDIFFSISLSDIFFGISLANIFFSSWFDGSGIAFYRGCNGEC